MDLDRSNDSWSDSTIRDWQPMSGAFCMRIEEVIADMMQPGYALDAYPLELREEQISPFLLSCARIFLILI